MKRSNVSTVKQNTNIIVRELIVSFHDDFIALIHLVNVPVFQVRVSKFNLFHHFGAWSNELQRPGGSMIITCDTERDVQILVELLRLSHDEKYDPPQDLVFEIIEMALKLRADKMVKRCAKRLEKSDFKTLNIAYKYLELSESAKSCTGIWKLREKAAELVRTEFKDIKAVVRMDINKFRSITPEGMCELLKWDDLIVDTENTLFYLLMSWVLKEPERKKRLSELFDHVRFCRMSKYFLLDVIPHVANNLRIEYPLTATKLLDLRRTALWFLAGGTRRYFQLNPSASSSPVFKSRSSYSIVNATAFRICHEFKEISAVTITSRLYSKPFLFNGYEFYVFMRPQPINSQGPALLDLDDLSMWTLACFTRCTSVILPPKHYLPVKTTVSIKTRDGVDRKFNPNSVVYEASEKAIGGKITLAQETLKQIVNGDSPIVINDAIHITVEIELLDSKAPVEIVNTIV